MITSNQSKLLHLVARKLGWITADGDDDLYRRVLAKIAGVESSKELDAAGFSAIMGFAEQCGFAPLAADGPTWGKRPGFASPAQLHLIRALWTEAHHGSFDEEAFNGWLRKFWKVDSLRFLRADQAQKVITGLKAWRKRAA